MHPARSIAALALVSSLGCTDVAQPPTADSAAPPAPTLVDEALLGELLAASVEIQGDVVTADAMLVQLAFEPLIRGTGPVSLQTVQSQGYRLTGVADRSPLWQLGLREGDVLTLVDGEPIVAREHELRSRWQARPSEVVLTYLRGEATHVLNLRVRPGVGWSGSPVPTRPIAQGDAADDTPEVPDEPEPPAEFSQGLRCTPGTNADEIGRCELERGAMDRMLADPSALARQMRIVPGIRDGETAGFKVYGIRSTSLASQVGLKNGDMITAINGHPLTNMDAALETYAKLRTASALVIELERAATAKSLKIVFVDVLSEPH